MSLVQIPPLRADTLPNEELAVRRFSVADLAIEKLITPLIRSAQHFLRENANEDIDFAQLLRYCVEPNTEAYVIMADIGSVIEDHESPPGAALSIIGFIAGRISDTMTVIDVLCVHQKLRRRGIASRLIAHFIDMGPDSLPCALEVRRSNIDAQAFYRLRGFSETGVKPMFYKSEDALVMQL